MLARRACGELALPAWFNLSLSSYDLARAAACFSRYWTACWRTLTGGFLRVWRTAHPDRPGWPCRPPAFYLRESYPPAWRDAEAVIDAPGFYRQLPVMGGALKPGTGALAARAAIG